MVAERDVGLDQCVEIRGRDNKQLDLRLGNA